PGAGPPRPTRFPYTTLFRSLGQIARIEGEDGQLSRIHFTTDAGDAEIPATRLLPFFGLTMKLGPVADWGLELNDNLIAVDTEKLDRKSTRLNSSHVKISYAV